MSERSEAAGPMPEKPSALEVIYRRVADIADTFTASANGLGVQALVEYGHRLQAFKERCKERLDKGEDFTRTPLIGDTLAQLNLVEEKLTEAYEELSVLRSIIGVETSRDARARMDAFRRGAYQTVQNDLLVLDLWPAYRSGTHLPEAPGDASLQAAVDWLLAQQDATRRERSESTLQSFGAPTPKESAPVQPQPEPTPTLTPQTFAVPPDNDVQPTAPAPDCSSDPGTPANCSPTGTEGGGGNDGDSGAAGDR